MTDANQFAFGLEIRINSAFIRSNLIETDKYMSYHFKTGIDLIRYVVGTSVKSKHHHNVMVSSIASSVEMQKLIWICDAPVPTSLDRGSEAC